MNLQGVRQVKERALRLEHIRFYGTGGIDVNGEWEWSGDYDMKLSSKHDPSEFNFYATIGRSVSKKGKTNGWYINLFLSMFYSNGRDIKLISQKTPSLKSAKAIILSKILDVHADMVGTQGLIEEWKNKHAKPVFALAGGEPKLIGTTYISAMSDMQYASDQKEVHWFNDDFPDYTKHRTVYELSFSAYIKPYSFYLHKTERTWGGYSGSSERNDVLIQKMVEIVRNSDRYAWMFKRVEESKEELNIN